MQRVPATKTQQSSCWPLVLKSAGQDPAERTPFTLPPLQVQANGEFEALIAAMHSHDATPALLAAKP